MKLILLFELYMCMVWLCGEREIWLKIRIKSGEGLMVNFGM